MAQDKDTVVADFLRDAQWRVSQLAQSIDNARRDGRPHLTEFNLRSELIAFMDILYDSNHSIYDNYNYLDSWTDDEIIGECEYLRSKSGMNVAAFITFTGYTPSIVNELKGTSGGVSWPAGNPGDFLVYPAGGGDPVPEPFPIFVGMSTEDLTAYFS